MTPTDARANFAAWNDRVRANAFHADPHLAALMRYYGRDIADDLAKFGAETADRLDALARETNRDENLPRLRKYDAVGRRIEAIEFHPGYHELGRAVYATGVMSRYRDLGRELESLALLYLYAQNGEAGHACPLACTAGLIKILQADGNAPADWLERLYDPSYDTHFHGAQFLTEVQGGSDVGANALVARQGPDGWRLHGEKWFCSVADAQMFLVTARPEGGPGGTRGILAFAVPRHVDGEVNRFSLRRLKYKLGTRSMASAEIDFEGAWAQPVGDFRRVVEVVLDTSRVYNAVCSSAMLQRAFREAHAYASTRIAFGQPILKFPTLARVVARLRTEAYAARSTTFRIADLTDRIALGKVTETEHAAWRMLVNLNKYWTSYAGTSGARDAIEVMGGNGAIEEFTVLPRLLRDSIVCEAWEGGHNVLCAQVLRDAQRLQLHRPMFAWLEGLAGPHPRLDAVRARFDRLLELPNAEAHVRDVAAELRSVAQGLSLLAEGDADPLVPVAAEHLMITNERGYDPLADTGLAERIRRLVA